MNYPKVTYSHLQYAITSEHHYVGQRPELTEKELTSFALLAYPFPEVYFWDKLNIHQRINKGYIKAQGKRLKLRRDLLADKRKAFIWAHDNLSIFDNEGNYMTDHSGVKYASL